MPISFTVAHNIAVQLSKQGLSPKHHPSALEQRISVETKVFGKTFPNPIGLGAGFDKDGEIIQPMLDLGFGFTEIGTVTVKPQPGNAKPRMFRLPADFGIVNRYGFNSKGAAAVEANLVAWRNPPPVVAKQGAEDDDNNASFTMRALHWLHSKALYLINQPTLAAVGLVGVNIGKNKASTEFEQVVSDYVSNIVLLGRYADYLVLNISSPNTAGLRDLQQADILRALLQPCLAARDALDERVPMLIKLAPDLADDDLAAIAAVLLDLEIDGIVVSNTTNQRPNDLISKHRSEPGGLSGAPVKDKSTEVIRKMFALTRGKIPIIGVGGVGSGYDAYAKLKAGASLVQVYSMMIYQGPGVVSRIRHELAELMLQNGQRSLQDVVGVDHDEIFWQRSQDRYQQTVPTIDEPLVIDNETK